jgi:hypothetical protein
MKARPEASERSWWREPMLWLVIGGPLTVVIAATVTAVIAWRGADALEPMDPPTASASQSPSMQAAVKARNHAAAPQQR